MKVITNWRNASEEIAKAFTKRYFPDEIYGDDTFWVADNVGGIFVVIEMFFDLNRMIEALELKATRAELHNYYDAEVENFSENPEKPMSMNFRNYVKYGKQLAKDEKAKLKSALWRK